MQERIFYDIERETIITEAQLRNEYEEMKSSGDTEAKTFSDYVLNCMTYNNGTLEEVDVEYYLGII